MTTLTEFKKSDPWDYNAKADKAQILDLAARKFVTISGEGNPNGADFALATTALYGLCYGVRMSYRSPSPPQGSGTYTVGVLQGRWDLVDKSKSYNPNLKDNLAWTIMIRQPDFLGQDLFKDFVEGAKSKALKKNEAAIPWFDKLRFESSFEGLYAQILHPGPYDSEPETFARLEGLVTAQGYERASKIHFEIYLSDPRKVGPDKLKTILRIPVKKMT